MMRVEPVGWPDLHGFEVDWWGKEEEHEERDEHTPTRYKRTPTRCYPVSPARPDPHTQ